MQDTDELSEFDLELINALQIDPRVSWQRLAGILDVAPSTLSRRWQSLVSAGLAWVTTSPGTRHLDIGATAFLLLDVVPGRISAVMSRLASEPMFSTVSQLAGSSDLLIDCHAPTAEELTQLLTAGDLLGADTNRREVLVATRMHREASWWRAGALEPLKARRIHEQSSARSRGAAFDGIDASIIAALGEDGRMSWAEVGARSGVAAATARRRAEAMLASGAFSLRCDAAAALRQGRHGVTLLLDVPAPQLDDIGRWFGKRNDCRVCVEVIGRANLLVTLWVQDWTELRACEREVAVIAPGTRTVGRHTELRTTKRLGVLLDERGRRRGRQPLRLVSG